MVLVSAIWLKPTAKHEGLHGSVREVRTELARTMDQHNYRKIDFNIFKQIQRFSSSGNLLEDKQINPDGTVASLDIYLYNQDGTLKAKASCDQDKNPRTQWHFQYEALEDGTQKVNEQFIDENGDTTNLDVHIIDSQGRKLLDQSYENGELVIVNEFSYDTIDNDTKMTWITKNAKGELIKHREYLFDIYENIKQKIEYTLQGEIETKEILTYVDQNPINGPIIESAVYQKDNLVYRYLYDYEFDEQNNWTLKTVKVQFNAQLDQKTEEYVSEIIKREIEYYP